MGIKTPYICEIAPDTYAINEFGLATMYLLVGQKQALLIDTGCGVCDIKNVVNSLTDKQCVIAITHGHFDHVGGAGCFDEVYLNEKDFALAGTLNPDEVKNFADAFGKAGGYQVFEYSVETILENVNLPKFISLSEGFSFDLGERVVEVYEIPGHTEGGLAFLDIKNRIIFSGDCCNTNLLASFCSVEATLKALRKFKSLAPKFEQNFNGHTGYMGLPECRSQPVEVTDDLIHICESILKNEGTTEPFSFLGHDFIKMSYGCAQLSYDPSRLAEEEN